MLFQTFFLRKFQISLNMELKIGLFIWVAKIKNGCDYIFDDNI